jgi:prepilin-type N-terminal cleavage/methylation domain-containing protein
MSVLNLFGFEDLKSLKARLGQISPADVTDPKLKRQLGKLQAKQGGFSLLELLIVVAIIAAIAAASSIMINGADKNAKAAVNADAIDATFKSLETFRVLNGGQYPDFFDSLTQEDTAAFTAGAKAAFLSSGLSSMLLSGEVVTTGTTLLALNNVGIKNLQVVNAAAGGSCSALLAAALATDYTTYLRNKAAQVLAGDLYKTGAGVPASPGCGASVALADGALLLAVDTATPATLSRLNLPAGSTNRYYAFGVGPSSTLFNVNYAGALNRPGQDSTLAIDKYNRYVAIFDAGLTATYSADARLVGVLSARGKTFSEELGIWNGAL